MRRPSVSPLLREPPFRPFWLGQSISQLGDQVSLLALPLTGVLTLDASPADMGYLTAAGYAPHLLLSLVAGVWLDRVASRRRVMIAADVGRALLLASVPAAYLAGILTLVQLYAVALASGALTVFFDLSWATLYVAVAPRERFVEANQLLQGSRAFSFVAGPSAAGFLVQLAAAPLAILVDAVSFVGSAACLLRVRAVEPPLEQEQTALRERLLAGGRFIAASPILRASLAAFATVNFFNFVFHAIFILYCTRALHVRPGELGAVLGAGALGGLAGAGLAGRVNRRLGLGRALVLGCVGFTAPLVLVPLAGGPRPLLLGMLFAAEFLSSVGVMILDVSGNAIQTAATPDRLRSRVVGAHRFVNYGVRPLGALAGGLAAGAVGLRPTLWAATIGAILGVLWLLPSPVPGLRELPDGPV